MMHSTTRPEESRYGKGYSTPQVLRFPYKGEPRMGGKVLYVVHWSRGQESGDMVNGRSEEGIL